MYRAEAQRTEGQSPDTLCHQRLLELSRLWTVDAPIREKEEDITCAEPAKCESKRAGGRRVEPLDVIDGDQNRLSFGE